jgi:hypothetical protein
VKILYSPELVSGLERLQRKTGTLLLKKTQSFAPKTENKFDLKKILSKVYTPKGFFILELLGL